MDMTKSEVGQFLTQGTKNAHCATCAFILYVGFSQILSHISKNTPGSTVLMFSTKRDETRYVHCNRKSVYAPSVQWLLNARTRAAANVSIENKQKTGVSKDRRYTKLKKAGDFCVCSCHTSLTATGPCNECSM